MKKEIHIFTEPEIMAESLAEEFFRYANSIFQTKTKFFVALSGGNTPLLFFTKLGEFNQQRKNKIEWKRVHFFWGDERCVPPEDDDSNFGSAKKVLINHIDIPKENIHRIHGEDEAIIEVKRYSDLLLKQIPSQGSIPVFDWILLGVGDDGHTASIFPNQIKLISTEGLCAIAEHPESGQKRITLTGNVINAAKRITFIVAGESKKEIIRQIINNETPSRKFPAAKIKPQNGFVDWYLDSEAADDL